MGNDLLSHSAMRSDTRVANVHHASRGEVDSVRILVHCDLSS